MRARYDVPDEVILSEESGSEPTPVDRGLPPWQYKADGPLLSMDEEVELTRRIRGGDQQARERSNMQLADRLGRQPTMEELAEETHLTVGTVSALLQTVQEPVSLDVLLGEAEDYTLGDLQLDVTAPDPEERALDAADRDHLGTILGILKPEERCVIENRYGLRDGRVHSLEELADELH